MSSCTKVCYPTRHAAMTAMRAIIRRCAGREVTTPAGAYFCSGCHHWHLTSRPGVQISPWSRRKRAPAST